jgi:hypothetical protein
MVEDVSAERETLDKIIKKKSGKDKMKLEEAKWNKYSR